MPLAWSSKKQSIRAYSTCEAEFVAVSDTIVLTEHQGYLGWLLQQSSIPKNIFVDNMSTLMVSKQVIHTKKSKHYALRFLRVKDNKDILAWCPTGKNRSDPLTKPLTRMAYLRMLGVEANYVSLCDNFEEELDETTCLAFYCGL